MKEVKIEKIYDYPKNDSRIPVAYVIVNNESLGGGGFGEVFKVRREEEGEPPNNNQFFALKKIKKEGIINDKDKHYRVLSEIKIHRMLKNKYICKYEHSFEDEQNIYILLEYCERKSLDDYLKIRKTLTEYETRYYMFQVLQGLKYLRRKKVVHRDLTIANLFLKDIKSIKIGDFGLSYIETENEEKPGLMCGTQGYFTPEHVQTKYSYKTDVFYFGVCIYHLMTGLTLFKDAATSFDMIKKNDIIYDEKTKFSKQCKDLFEQIFTFESKRIDLEEIAMHPFFNGGKGLVDVDFPNYFDEKMNKKAFEEKIKILEKNVIMTDVSVIKRKTENLSNKKSDGEFSNDSGNNSFKNGVNNNLNNNPNNKAEYNLKDQIKNLLIKNQIKELDNNSIKDKYINNNINKQNNTLKNDDNKNNILTKEKKENNPFKEHSPEKDNMGMLIEGEINKQKNIPQKIVKKHSIPLLDLGINENEKEEEEEEESEKVEKENNSFNDVDTLNPKENNKNKFIEEELDISEEEEKMNSLQKIYIKKIIQENNKFGIGYLLNNDDIGILFNDDSIMTKFSEYKNLIYYRNPINNLHKILLPMKSESNKDLSNKIYFFSYIIEEVIKKKSRVKFVNNKEENSKNDIELENEIVNEQKKNNIHKNDVYLLKYKKNYYAHFFILSNNNIQIKYIDGVDIIFCCSKNKKIIYINHEGNKAEFDLGPNKEFTNFICKDQKINKRIKYAIKEIIK